MDQRRDLAKSGSAASCSVIEPGSTNWRSDPGLWVPVTSAALLAIGEAFGMRDIGLTGSSNAELGGLRQADVLTCMRRSHPKPRT